MIAVLRKDQILVKLIFLCLITCYVKGINQKCDNTLKEQEKFSLVKLLSDTQQCPTNSQCTQRNYCACDRGYFGNCQTTGTYLSGESKEYTITDEMSYFIIEPTINEFVSFQFILCNEKNDESMSELLNLWVDDGSMITPNERNALGNDKELKITQSCIALVTSFFTFSEQVNGEKELLILGIRLKEQGSVKIQLLVQEVELFGIDIIFKIILILVCGIALISLAAVVYCIYKCRRRGIDGNLTEERNDISFFDEYMPAIKANLHEVKEEICSVCLGEYKEGEEIRHTVCAHYFHKTCLDEWCVTNLSCPICRTSFEKANLIHNQYLLSSRNSTQSTSNYERNNEQELLENGLINGETNLREPIV